MKLSDFNRKDMKYVEEYLLAIIKGEKYAELTRETLKAKLAALEDPQTGQNLLVQEQNAELLSDDVKKILEERIAKAEGNTENILLRIRYALQMVLRENFTIPEELVVYILKYLNGVIWYVKYRNESMLDVATRLRDEKLDEFEEMLETLLGREQK